MEGLSATFYTGFCSTFTEDYAGLGETSLYFLARGFFFAKMSVYSSESPPNSLLMFFFLGSSTLICLASLFYANPKGFDFF